MIGDNKEYVKQRAKAYSQKHREQLTLNKKKRYKTDLQFRLAEVLRSRLKRALKKNIRTGSAVRDLGCSLDDLRIHLESKFYCNKLTGEVMCWENYGPNGWHIDHKIPLSSFNLADTIELKKACHFSNLQPMWAEENKSKGNKIL
jgi:hypothetical protein